MPPLVVGFPVLARPKGCDGLEMHSLSDLLDFCKASDVTLVEGVIFIEGQRAVLFLSQTIGNMLVWMNADRGDINPSGFSRMTVSVKGYLEGARHIYGKGITHSEIFWKPTNAGIRSKTVQRIASFW